MERLEIIEALKMEDFTPIYERANDIRKERKGDDVLIRAIIEFSSYCKMPCKYCGLNAANDKATRYRMETDEIMAVAKEAIEAGYGTIVLQGGEDPEFADGVRLARVIEEIKSINSDVAVTLSAGELKKEVLQKLKRAGADRYLLRHETSDKNLYESLHPGKYLKDRIAVLYNLKEIGYETGSGFMVGIPNQSIESLADDLIKLTEIPCDMAGIGPYISHPDTPLGGSQNGSVELTKRCVAIGRILLPNANLPVTTAVGVLNVEERKKAFDCGANVIMRKVNPKKYKDAYKIYPSDLDETNVLKERIELENMIRSIGRRPV